MFSDTYLKDFKGLADTHIVQITDEGTRLDAKPCKFVKISNFNVENIPTLPTEFTREAATEGGEIYFGFGGTPTMQIFAGESSELLPISNLDQITLQARPGATKTIWVTYFY